MPRVWDTSGKDGRPRMFAPRANQAFPSRRTMIYPCLLTAAILLELDPVGSEAVVT